MDMGYSDEQLCDVRSLDSKNYILEKTSGRWDSDLLIL